MPVKRIDNVNELLLDDLKSSIKKGSKISIAAAYFSMFAYQELKEQLEQLESFRFIYTSPTFIKEKLKKEQREFYIPRLNRESSLYGTEFEIKLRNELTQKAIASECADWIRKKAQFKSNSSSDVVKESFVLEAEPDVISYSTVDGFTTVDLGCEKGNYKSYRIKRYAGDLAEDDLLDFDELWKDKTILDVTEEIIEHISKVYAENPPEFVYYMTLYHVFQEFLEDINEDVLPNEATGYKNSEVWGMLYNFQQDAVLAIINKLEKYNGCILADSVGLGKTFTALAVIKYYENRNKNVLVLCPKKLSENWNTYKGNYRNNPLVKDRLRYDVLYHTDLSRKGGTSNGLDLDRLNWGNYDLLVIDESHNFRNGAGTNDKSKENRYMRLMNQVLKSGVKTKVLMLSATPVNNKFSDLKHQLALAYEGNTELINQKLGTKKPIENIFKQAESAFGRWGKLPAEKRNTESLLESLDFDFFELLDSVTIARSRRHIEKYYDTSALGKFPERLEPLSLRPSLTTLQDGLNYAEIYAELMKLNLCIYLPTSFIHASCISKYTDGMPNQREGLTQKGREQGIHRLMSINLLKRLESSVEAFRLTLNSILHLIQKTIASIEEYEQFGVGSLETQQAGESDFDMEDAGTDYFQVGNKIKINLADMDYMDWKRYLLEDAHTLEQLSKEMEHILPAQDSKLQELLELIGHKIQNPINAGNKKIIVFTAFADTANYLYENLAPLMKKRFGIESALITGTGDGRSTLSGAKGWKNDLNNVLTCFSPISKHRDLLHISDNLNIDLLIATDCISEGQNLQDCDYLINYDIHWNPVRIIQRFGRIDRIGSKNACIQLVNFWPDVDLDTYLNLKNRVESKMIATIATATGDDNLLDSEENGDLEYRKKQLMRLQNEVVDLEDMGEGISIMDLGLNEFRLDLQDYHKQHEDLGKKPKGLHAIVPAGEDCPKGAIFVLRNVNESLKSDKKNQLHPYYMVYISEDGEVHCDYLHSKKLLDTLRLLCRGKDSPIQDLCDAFNKESKDGKDMTVVSALLSDAIHSIIDVKEESDLNSLFSFGGTNALRAEVSGLDDFELICFLLIK